MPGSQMFFNGKQLHLQKNVCLHLLSPCTECEILSDSDQRHKGFLGTGELAQWKLSMGWGIYIFGSWFTNLNTFPEVINLLCGSFLRFKKSAPSILDFMFSPSTACPFFGITLPKGVERTPRIHWIFTGDEEPSTFLNSLYENRFPPPLFSLLRQDLTR